MIWDPKMNSVIFHACGYSMAELSDSAKAKKWHAPIYGFFKPTPDIEYKNNRCSHIFCCLAKGCSGVVHHFVDNDVLTKNLIRHARKCFGEDTVTVAKNAKDAQEVCDKIVGSILRDGTITAVFQRKDREKVFYSHRQHTRTETRLVALHTCRAPVDSLDWSAGLRKATGPSTLLRTVVFNV